LQIQAHIRDIAFIERQTALLLLSFALILSGLKPPIMSVMDLGDRSGLIFAM
jgi:hypothetical protein